jgi:hypothetical protein
LCLHQDVVDSRNEADVVTYTAAFLN